MSGHPSEPVGRVGKGLLARALAAPVGRLGLPAMVVGGGLSGLCAISAVVIVALAVLEGEWMVFSFELVILLAGVFGVLTAMGRFERGVAISLAIVGGMIAGLAVLTEPATITSLMGSAGAPISLRGVELVPVMYGRMAAGVGVMIAGAVIVWTRRPAESVGYLIRAALCGVAVNAILLVILWDSFRPAVLRMGSFGGGVTDAFVGLGDGVAGLVNALPFFIRVIGVITGFFAGLGLLAAFGHCLIRSFEAGSFAGDGRESALGKGEATQASGRPAHT